MATKRPDFRPALSKYPDPNRLGSQLGL